MLLLKKQNNLFLQKRFAYQTANPSEAVSQQAPAPAEQPKTTTEQPVSPAVKPVADSQRGRVELAQQLPPRPLTTGDTSSSTTKTDLPSSVETPSNAPKSAPKPGETFPAQQNLANAPSSAVANTPTAAQATTPVAVENLVQGAGGLVDKITGWASSAFAMLGPLFEKLGPLLEKVSTIWTMVKNKIKSVLPAGMAKAILPDEDGSTDNQSPPENQHKGKVDSAIADATGRFQDRLTLSGQINLGLNNPYAVQQGTKFICDALGIADQGSPDKLLATLKNSGATIVDNHETTAELKVGDLIAFKTENAEGKYQLTDFGIISAISDQGIKYKALPDGMAGPASPVEMQFSVSDKFFGFIRLPDGLNRQIKGGPMQGVSAAPAGAPNLPAGVLAQQEQTATVDKSKLFDTALATIGAAMNPKDKGIKDYDNGGILNFSEKEGPTYKGLKGMLLAYYTTLGAAAAENQFNTAKALFDGNKDLDQMFNFTHLTENMGLGKYFDLLKEINTEDYTIKGYLAGLLKIMDDKMGSVPANAQAKVRADYLAYLIAEFKPLSDAARLDHLQKIKDPEIFKKSLASVAAQTPATSPAQNPALAPTQNPLATPQQQSASVPQVPPNSPT